MSLEQVMGNITIALPEHSAVCSAKRDGAAAAVLVNRAKLKICRWSSGAPSRPAAEIRPSDPGREGCQVLPTSTGSP